MTVRNEEWLAMHRLEYVLWPVLCLFFVTVGWVGIYLDSYFIALMGGMTSNMIVGLAMFFALKRRQGLKVLMGYGLAMPALTAIFGALLGILFAQTWGDQLDSMGWI